MPVADITGFALSFTLHNRAGTVVFTKTLAAGDIVITNTAIGTGTLTVLSAVTGALTAGNYRFQIRRTDTGNNKMLAYGSINLRL